MGDPATSCLNNQIVHFQRVNSRLVRSVHGGQVKDMEGMVKDLEEDKYGL
jgi:hypothetical protein